MKCKACGCEIEEYATVAYCPLCRVKRRMKTMEIDHDTGLWEGQEP
jgi:Zn finger protein HypA/HybF involved in hydrogenase expression